MKLREIALTPPIVAIIISIGLMFDASAADWYVSSDGTYGIEYGADEAHRATDVNAVLENSQLAEKDTVWLADGYVCETGGPTAKSNGYMSRIRVTKAITLRSESGDARTGNPPIIRGEWGDNTATSSSGKIASDSVIRRPIYVSAAAKIIGIVFERGCAAHSLEQNYSPYGGGGVSGKLATFEKCVIRNCFGAYGGGVHFPSNGSPADRMTYVDCVISNCASLYCGGGIYGPGCFTNCLIADCGRDADHATTWGGGASGADMNKMPELCGCVVSNCYSRTGAAGGYEVAAKDGSVFACNESAASGGGVYTSVLEDCEIVGNTASLSGGGAYQSDVRRCFIHDNEAGGNGGGVMGGTTICCVISNNVANYGGGAYCPAFESKKPLPMTNVCNRIVFNRAKSYGGGIYAGDNVSFYDNLIAWNRQLPTSDSMIGGGGFAGTWAGKESSMRYARLVNCTVVSNQTGGTASGGGSYCDLVNTIIYGNTKGNGGASNVSSVRSAVNSCAPELTDTTTYPGCTAANPKFRRGCVYQIGPRSPCRETGAILTDDAVFSSMQKDIDGNPRFGEKDGEPTIDMGCCQYAPFGLMLMVK